MTREECLALNATLFLNDEAPVTILAALELAMEHPGNTESQQRQLQYAADTMILYQLVINADDNEADAE
jgi:hypothetical protein